MAVQPYADLVRVTLSQTPVVDLLRSHEIVVLERVARGAGKTNWFYCTDSASLEFVISRLQPGSSVSFYFDGRIRNTTYAPDLFPELERIMAEDIDIVLGFLNDDGITLDVDFPGGPGDLAEATSGFDQKTRVFFGRFPGHDNDGVNAVTIDLPDSDGVVRHHPH